MRIPLQDLKRQLFAKLRARLAVEGFHERPKWQSFERVDELGRDSIHLSFINHDIDFDITVDVARRFDAVESLVHRSERLLSKSEKANTFTLGAELGNLEKGERHRWTVTTTTDLSAVSTAILEQVRRVGLPFLERFRQVEAAYDVLSQDGRDAWLCSPLHSKRAIRACAMLAVMGRWDELEFLGARKAEFLASVDVLNAPSFERFFHELRQQRRHEQLATEGTARSKR